MSVNVASDRKPTGLDATAFAALMDSVGPFERRPMLAVGVSGGADSLALCLLAAAWARRRRGRVTALTVDHGLRPESAAEARRVGMWVSAREIDHRVLRWRAEKPSRGVQSAARAARYRLLTDWCRSNGVLHLLLAHHLEDQAETLLLRLARGSGVDGLAAMSLSTETAGVRVLRPLIPVAKARLAATLRARRQPWIEDPSNADSAFARVRVRKAFPVLAREGLTPARLAQTARSMARARSALEGDTAALLARAAMPHPAGYIRLDPAMLAGEAVETSLRGLSRALVCVGAGPYPPRFARLERAHAAVISGAFTVARTLAGCRLVPDRSAVLVCREPAAACEEIEITPGGRALWDGRFAVAVKPSGRSRALARRRMVVRRLGKRGWDEVAAASPGLRKTPLPAAIRPSLPAFWDLEGVVAVPHLNFTRRDAHGDHAKGLAFSAFFCPTRPLAGAGFAGV